MNAAWSISVGLLTIAMAQTGAPRSEHSPQVAALIEKLPECSSLREQLRQGKFGDGTENPYMRLMLERGVQRAYFELKGVWRHRRADRIRIVRRLYYKQLDGPDAQITDAATLNEIAKTGLEATLDEAAQTKARTAVLHTGIDYWAGFGVIHAWRWQLAGSKIYGAVEFFANPWVPHQLPTWVSPYGDQNELSHAARIGDVINLAKLLNTHKYAQPELNSTLSEAAMSRWNNNTAIDLLIKAGADVNARFGGQATPLMLAIHSPCNVAVLLAQGARADDRNAWGQTALALARQRHDTVVVRLLETAGAKP